MTLDIYDLETYRDLLAAYQPRPFHTQEEVDQANVLLDALTELPQLSEGQRDFIALLAQLIQDWEAVHDDPSRISPHEMVRCLLDDNCLRQQDLVGPVFPTRSAVSDFLAGRRPLSYERVRRLAAFFHVSPAVFYP